MLRLFITTRCSEPRVYGVGPLLRTTRVSRMIVFGWQGHMSRNHSTASNSVHYFGGEFQLLLKLKQEGRLTICTEADPPTCGLPEALIRDFPSEDLLKGQAEDKDMDEDLGEGAASADEASTDRGSTRPDAGGTSLLPLDEQ